MKNWCFWTVVSENILGSLLDSKEIKPVHPKGNQSWIFTGRTDAETEAPILWPLDAKNWLIGKDADAGKDWGQEKGTTEDDWMASTFFGHEFEQAPRVGDGQGSLTCCSPWSCKELDTTERVNLIPVIWHCICSPSELRRHLWAVWFGPVGWAGHILNEAEQGREGRNKRFWGPPWTSGNLWDEQGEKALGLEHSGSCPPKCKRRNDKAWSTELHFWRTRARTQKPRLPEWYEDAVGGNCVEEGKEDSLLGNCQGLLRLCHPDPDVAKRRKISKNRALSQSSQIPPTSSRQFHGGARLSHPATGKGEGQGGSLPPKECLLATKGPERGHAKGCPPSLSTWHRSGGHPRMLIVHFLLDLFPKCRKTERLSLLL